MNEQLCSGEHKPIRISTYYLIPTCEMVLCYFFFAGIFLRVFFLAGRGCFDTDSMDLIPFDSYLLSFASVCDISQLFN